MAVVLPSHDFGMGSAVGSGQQQVPSGFSTEGIHILLVDDENVSRMVVGNLLRKCNYKGACDAAISSYSHGCFACLSG
jgi:hypothetical protein